MKNFVLISPHFPETYYLFARALKKNGFRVLGIGDAPYDTLKQELKDVLDEYYTCWGMDIFDNEVKALEYFESKYGHIDYLESNNEYWLVKDAKLREMFNISTGVMGKEIEEYNHKSKMKTHFKQAGANVAKWVLVDNYEQIKKFVSDVNYPIFIKPDCGVGATGNFKINNDEDLNKFFKEKNPNITYICEQFITGNIISFDGVANSKSEVIFVTCNYFPPSVADIVKEHKDLFYYCSPEVPSDLLKIGKKVIKAFKVKNRFFHIEFFRLTNDVEGVAKKGELVALETNMRPAGGYTPDLINYANSVDCYQIWADSFISDKLLVDTSWPKYYAACASRRDMNEYFYGDGNILSAWKSNMCWSGRYPDVLSDDLGNRFFMAKFKTIKELEVFHEFVNRSATYSMNSEKKTHKKNSRSLTGEDIDMFNERKQESKKSIDSICDTHIDGA